ncbi:MAG: hypothetical protein Unbinned3459contig1002_20 [Prokaryotic dsDNA virus sp.]|jgi:hypothetical protein|nr:MAG: hypothetical protein Unbinned3459contig1002_20 [Prokaryotic dsDNA virus sp.]
MKVRNMTGRTGQPVKNQFIISDGDALIFQSYNTVIAKREGYGENERIYLDRDSWDYSTTTGKYRNQFLGEGIEATRSKIASGEYILTDLN